MRQDVTASVMDSPRAGARGTGAGLTINRLFTKAGVDPLSQIAWTNRRSEIKTPDGAKTVFTMNNVEAPEDWSQVAVDIAADKYFRKAGVPGLGHEHSVRQLVDRVAKAIRAAGEKQGGYFATKEDAQAFEDELRYMLVTQRGAFNSPVWFNAGIYEAYGATGSACGLWAYDLDKGAAFETPNSYERPQCSACFIQAIDDDLMDIADFVKREMRLFKGGSGSGANFSNLRAEGEPLSSGGTSSGVMSYLDVFDKGAGAIKSGGTCLAPTQRVYTHRGPVPVKELAEKGEDFVVLSYDPPAGRYKAKWARAWLAGRKKVMRIVTDKGEFDLTYDHPVKLASEDAVRVEALKPGMALFACTVDIGNNGPYLRVGLRDGAKGRMRFNRMIAQDVMGLEIDGYSIHHEDENTFNNHPSNLMKKLQSDHARDHNAERVEAGEHVFQEQSFPHDGESNGMHNSSEFWKDEEKVSAYKAKQGEILKSSGRAAVMQRSAATQRMLNLGYRLINAGHEIDTFEKYWEARKVVVGPIGTPKAELLAAFENRFGSYENFTRELLLNNHRVVSVYELGEMDVYDVEVDCPTADDKSAESGHNFVIWTDGEFTGSGIAVHNTRRAAKMVILDVDHPDVETFVEWKAREEDKVLALTKAGFSKDEAYRTVSGQNANNSVRVTDEYMQAVVAGRPWDTLWRTSRRVARTLDAKKLFRKISEMAWKCADPGLQFDTTINKWHTTPNSGRINGSNPCQPAWATLLTPHGIRTMGEIKVGDEVWSGKQWTKVVRKIETGVKDVYAYRTQVGTFFGTSNHRVVQNGVKIEVKDAVCIDACQRPNSRGTTGTHEIFSRELLGPERVYDITVEADEHTYWTDGLLVSNCSEYMHLDNSACNLASVNAIKFMRRVETQAGVSYRFNVAEYRHAARIFTVAQEILVDYAAYPTQKIAENAHDYRQLGLGYANVGAMLMVMGYPYDSVEGQGVIAALTAILTGTGYQTSAEIAASKGPFPGFAHNRDPMLEVMRMHRDYANRVVAPAGYDELARAARETWTSAVELGSRWGYRNAQATVIAPTGTIGLMMDCDTTGIEPDFALVKAKKLAGGGFMSIANRSVTPALEVMGYTADQVKGIVQYLNGTRTIDGPQPINKTTLAAKGLTAAELVEVEASLPTAGNIKRALATVRNDKQHLDDLMKAFTDDEVSASNDVIFGRGTVEGAPYLKPEHLPVFDCASKSGKGTRFIAPMGHIKMLEAAQPFVSGSISKTVNCPNETTIDEIEQLYMEAWKRGLKCIAIYRDGSKHVQVLSSGNEKKPEKKTDATPAPEAKPLAKIKDDRSGHAPPPTQRHRLTKKRPGGFTQELAVGGQKIYLRTGEYADGSLGEVFIDMHKDGALLRSLMNAFAVAISLGLQHGVPLHEFVEAFTFTKFEPNGICDHEFVKMATSILDAVFRVLALEYLGEDGLEYVQKKPTDRQFAEQKIRRVLRRAANATSLADVDVTSLVAMLTGGGTVADGTSKIVLPPAVNGNGNGYATANGNGSSGHGDTKTYKRSVVEGQACSRCGNLTVRTGTCNTCGSCGLTTGCG